MNKQTEALLNINNEEIKRLKIMDRITSAPKVWYNFKTKDVLVGNLDIDAIRCPEDWEYVALVRIIEGDL